MLVNHFPLVREPTLSCAIRSSRSGAAPSAPPTGTAVPRPRRRLRPPAHPADHLVRRRPLRGGLPRLPARVGAGAATRRESCTTSWPRRSQRADGLRGLGRCRRRASPLGAGDAGPVGPAGSALGAGGFLFEDLAERPGGRRGGAGEACEVKTSRRGAPGGRAAGVRLPAPRPDRGAGRPRCPTRPGGCAPAGRRSRSARRARTPRPGRAARPSAGMRCRAAPSPTARPGVGSRAIGAARPPWRARQPDRVAAAAARGRGSARRGAACAGVLLGDHQVEVARPDSRRARSSGSRWTISTRSVRVVAANMSAACGIRPSAADWNTASRTRAGPPGPRSRRARPRPVPALEHLGRRGRPAARPAG